MHILTLPTAYTVTFFPRDTAMRAKIFSMSRGSRRFAHVLKISYVTAPSCIVGWSGIGVKTDQCASRTEIASK